MSTQIVQHKSRDFDVVLNFAESENNLSWAFTAENDGEIYDVILINVASYQITGSSVTLPLTVTAGLSYAVSIVKQTNGQTASITLKTRRAVNKAVTLNVPDFGNLDVNNNYILHNDNTVTVIDNAKVSSANYQGGGIFTESIIRGVVQLPDLSSVANFKWQHLFYDEGFVFVAGWCTSRNDAFPNIAFCKIDTTSLNVYDIDGAEGSYTAIYSWAFRNSFQRMGGMWFDFVNKNIIISTDAFFTIDLNSRSVVSNFNFSVADNGIQVATFLIGWVNPQAQSLAGLYGTFKRDESSHYSADTSNYIYDAKIGGKLGTINYWGRLFWRDEKGGTIFSIDYSTLGGTASFLTPKGDLVFMCSTQRAAVILKKSPFTFTHQLLSNYNATSIVSSLYMSSDGLKHCMALNNGRLLFFEIASDATTITEMFLDTNKPINSMIPEKPLTSL